MCLMSVNMSEKGMRNKNKIAYPVWKNNTPDAPYLRWLTMIHTPPTPTNA